MSQKMNLGNTRFALTSQHRIAATHHWLEERQGTEARSSVRGSCCKDLDKAEMIAWTRLVTVEMWKWSDSLYTLRVTLTEFTDELDMTFRKMIPFLWNHENASSVYRGGKREKQIWSENWEFSFGHIHNGHPSGDAQWAGGIYVWSLEECLGQERHNWNNT